MFGKDKEKKICLEILKNKSILYVFVHIKILMD